MPGATIDARGLVSGPCSIVDDKSYAEAEANVASALKGAAFGLVLPLD